MTHTRAYRVQMGDRDFRLLEGPCGWGECSPLPGYPCSPATALAAATEAATRTWPTPLRDVVPVNALVSGLDPDPADLAGFACVKVKVGRLDVRSDISLVSAVRDMVGPSVALRVDANGAWDETTAESALTSLAPYGIELAEQPVTGLEAMARLRRRVRVPLAADECVRSLQDARRLRSLRAADAVVLKVQPLGGMWAALDVAEAAGVPALVSSMMETSVGIAVGLHLAASLPELPHACGLATLGMLAADVTRAPLTPAGGVLSVRRVVPDLDLLVREAQDDPVQESRS
jgi:O-succinylbenzoate synthase